MTNKVYLVDGSGYIFRAYYAISPLSTKEGFPTNALFGFTKMLLKLLSEADSQHVVIAFDAGKKTFRNDLYPEYKANRRECPEDLAKQMPYFRELASALGLPILELPGYEADDIIGTLTERLTAAGMETVIVTADKDMMQLVGPQVSLWDTMRDRHVREAEVLEKFGVAPHRVVEVLGLMGDSSDNIPGLRGVGPKTATQLIEKFGDVETVIARVEEIKGDSSIKNRKKIAEQIELDADVLRLSRKLVEIDRNTPLKIGLGDTPVSAEELSNEALYETLLRRPPSAALTDLVERFEFSSLVKDFDFSTKSKNKAVEAKYEIIWKKDFETWFKDFSAQKIYALDLETTSLDYLEAKIVGFAFCWSADRSFYIPVGHVHADQEQMSAEEVLRRCGASLRDAAIKKVGQNIKYDISVLGAHGVEVGGVAFDTMVAAYLLNPDRRSFSLGSLSKDYLGFDATEYEEVSGDAENFSFVPVDAAAAYSAEDAHFAWLLKEKLEGEIEKGNLGKVFYEIEMPLVPVLAAMELRGVKLDTDLLRAMSKEFEHDLAAARTELVALAGCEFNLNSPKQLADVLFNKLGISTKGLKKTKTGVSTDSSVLEQLADQHPLPAKILHHRMLHKLKNTYIDVLPAMVSPRSHRLHARFNQTIAGTGRLSSSDPNLQNIPIQRPEGRRIRTAFIAEPGRVLISADYSQIELRLLAHLSADETLMNAFRQGMDIHEKTTREILHLGDDQEVTSDQRRMGKTINFGIVYGMSGFRLGKELGIPVGVANSYIEAYFDRYPGVKKLFAEIEKNAETQGYVTTLFGRKRIITDLNMEGRDRGFAMRAAINAPLQGSAADLIKLAMIAIIEKIKTRKLRVELIMQIHDELVFECDEDVAAEAMSLVQETMEHVVELRVPLKVDIASGKNWQEAH